MALVVATFYKFVRLPDCAEKQQALIEFCRSQDIKGTILLATEGINGTIAGSRAAIAAVLTFLKSDSRLANLEHKESFADNFPFQRLKVKLKREIVTLGVPDIDPNERAGTPVNPQDWNALISDPDVLVIDTRNQYEVSIGTFQGALNPQTASFRDLPEFVATNLDTAQHKRVAMFCTGGIRCEKASAYLLQQGFQQVYQLQGGILKYLQDVSAEDSLWQGECFVFDERVAVKHGLEPGSYDMCPSCGYPISEQDKLAPSYEAGICCPHCADNLTPDKRARQQERHPDFRF